MLKRTFYFSISDHFQDQMHNIDLDIFKGLDIDIDFEIYIDIDIDIPIDNYAYIDIEIHMYSVI